MPRKKKHKRSHPSQINEWDRLPAGTGNIQRAPLLSLSLGFELLRLRKRLLAPGTRFLPPFSCSTSSCHGTFWRFVSNFKGSEAGEAESVTGWWQQRPPHSPADKDIPWPPPRNLGALGQLLKHKAGSSCQHPAGNTPQQQQTCPCCCSGDGYSRFDSCSCPRRMPEATLRGKHCRKEGGREAEGGPVPKHHAAGPRVAADRPQEVGLNPLPKPRDSRHKLLSRRLFMKSQSRRAGPQHMQSIKMFTTAQGGGIRKAPALETSSSDESCSSEPKSCPHKSARPAESSSHGKPPPAVPGQGSAASMGAKGEEPSATRHSRGALPAPVSSPGNFPAAFGLAG